MFRKYTTDNVKTLMKECGYELLSEYVTAKIKVKLRDKDGYIVYGWVNEIIDGVKPRPFDKSNPDSIANINLFLKKT